MANVQTMPQQAMAGQPGGQPRPANPPVQANQMKSAQQIQPREFQPTFHGFSLRKAPADPGERPSWDRIKPQPFPVSAKEFNSENRSARSQVAPYKVYEHLRTDSQREAIDRLINNFKAHETNPNAVWEIAYIKANRVVIPGTWGRAEETKDIRVIFKRYPLPYGQQPNPQLGDFPYGKIIDTTVAEPFPIPVQKNIPPQQPQAQQAQPTQQAQQGQQGQQGQAKAPQQPQQQQQQMNQPRLNQQQSGPMAMPPLPSMNNQPPPPSNMPPPFGGNQLPPFPMQGPPPPGAMQGNRPNPGNAAPVTQIFNLAQPEKTKKHKSEKAKSARRRSQSPHPRNQLRESMNALEKVDKWQLPIDSDSESDNSDSSDSSNDSGSSVAAHRGDHHSAKAYNKSSFRVPPPPMGPNAPRATAPRNSQLKAHAIVKPKSSIKDIRGKNKRVIERGTTERYRRGSSLSDEDYEFIDHPGSRPTETPMDTMDDPDTITASEAGTEVAAESALDMTALLDATEAEVMIEPLPATEPEVVIAAHIPSNAKTAYANIVSQTPIEVSLLHPRNKNQSSSTTTSTQVQTAPTAPRPHHSKHQQ
ncbi:hypothetical protein FKW77_004567 [Venturia effusa]|uniref:Uncharacterized protein n=1 Tax=Venturia effusa TaxID=50376 RepID=A0A517LNU8_9PEZI|nr:hypothetical protein FKW77_004567 [Venturia effusa]